MRKKCRGNKEEHEEKNRNRPTTSPLPLQYFWKDLVE
jgi:hypothetical protein